MLYVFKLVLYLYAFKEIDKNFKTAKSVDEKAELLTVASQLELKKGNPQGASKFLEQLIGLKPNDDTIKCKLIGIYSEFDAKKAKALTDKVLF